MTGVELFTLAALACHTSTGRTSEAPALGTQLQCQQVLIACIANQKDFSHPVLVLPNTWMNCLARAKKNFDD